MEPPATDKKSFGWSPVTAIVVTIGIYLITQFAVALLVILYAYVHGWRGHQATDWLNQSVTAQFILVALVEFATLGLLYVFLRRHKAGFKQLGLVRPKLRDGAYALAGFGVYFPLNLAGLSLAHALTNINIDQKQQLGFDTAHGPLLVLVFVALVVLAPITEEILVRGFLYGSLKAYWPMLKAALATSALFALAHLQFGSGAPLLWVAAIDTFILSLVLIYLRNKSGGLAAPIILHMLKNGLAFSALFLWHIS